MIDDPAVAGVSARPGPGAVLAELVVPGSPAHSPQDRPAPAEGELPLRTWNNTGDRARRAATTGQHDRRIMQATAAGYVISPSTLGAAGRTPRAPDAALGALADRGGRAHRARGRELLIGATKVGNALATLTIDGEIGSPPQPIGPRSPTSWPRRDQPWSASTRREKHRRPARTGSSSPCIPTSNEGPVDGSRAGQTRRLDATPEQVWEVIATGPALHRFVPHEVEEREAGRSRSFGSGFDATWGTSLGTGTPLRLRGSRGPPEGAPTTPSSSSSRGPTAAAPCCVLCRAASWTRAGRTSTRATTRAGPVLLNLRAT